MASIQRKVVRVQLGTSSGGTLDFTSSGFGTPKAALFFLSTSAAIDTSDTDYSLNLGFTDGTRQRAHADFDRNGQAVVSDCGRRRRNDCCGLALNADGAIGAKLAFNSWITDGVRVDVTRDPTSGAESWYAYCVLFGGDDLSAYVGEFSLASGTLDVTDPGFEPDVVIGTGGGNVFTGGSLFNNGFACFGVCANSGGGSVSQGCVTRWSQDGVSTTNIMGHLTATNFYQRITSAGLTETVSLGSFDSSGFTATYGGSGTTARIGYLALSFGGRTTGQKVSVYVPSTSTGTQNFTAPGHQPSLAILLQTNIASLDSLVTGGLAGLLAIGAIDESDEYTHFTRSRDAVTTTDTACRNQAVGVYMRNQTGGTAFEASRTSFLSTGIEFDVTTAPPNNRQVLVLTIGETVTSGSGADTTPVPVAAGTGEVIDSGSGAGVSAVPTAEGSATLSIPGSGADVATSPTSDGTGVVSIPGSGAGDVPTASAAGTGVVEVLGSGDGVAPLATAAGSGSADVEVDGSGAGVAPRATSEGAATVVDPGSGSGVSSTPSASGSGVLSIPGSGAGFVPQPSVSGSGVLTAAGSGAPTAAVASASGSGSLSMSGSGAPTAAPPTAAGTGSVVVSGSGAGQTAVPSVDGAGGVGATGAGALVAPLARCTGSGFVEGGPEPSAENRGLMLTKKTIGLNRLRGPS